MNKKKYFLAVTQDGYCERGHRAPAINILQSRLANRTWPLYAFTKNRRRIGEGDGLFFYIGGKGLHGGHTVAMADVIRRQDAGRRSLKDEYATSTLSAILELDNIEFTCPVYLKTVLIDCGVIQKDNKKWGAFLMGGICRLPELVVQKLSGSDK